MLLLLALWLCCIHFTNQEICQSPGDLPAPQLFLAKASNEERDIIVLKCKIPSLSPSTRVIFCKDGKDLASQPMQEGKFAYDYKVKENSIRRFTCLYQHKDNQNQEKNSLLSTTLQNITDEVATGTMSEDYNGLTFKLIMGIAISTFLVLAVACFLLIRKDTTTAGFPRDSVTCSQTRGDMVVTYATVGHCTGQQVSHMPVGETEDELHPYAIGFGV